MGKPMAEKKQRALLRQFVAASSPHDPAAPPPPAPALGFGEAERTGNVCVVCVRVRAFVCVYVCMHINMDVCVRACLCVYRCS